ncbi:hypothetical protein Mpsy_0176 [Methanolobus psychrophilus R15]|nr:hypothetical protein Mpsy_0176 [Methanolobus psychrophilus R15]
MDLKSDDFLHNQEKSVFNETDSLIAKVCDQFNLKDTIIQLSKKTPLQVTSKFIDATILFIFLCIVFSEAEVLKLEYSFPMVVLAVIGFSAIMEAFYVNTSLLKRYIGRDANVKRFLDKMPTLSPGQIRGEIKNLRFSSRCINYFLSHIKYEKNEYPPYVIENILVTHILSKENLDLLFSPAILKSILPEVIITVLSQYKNCLTYEHVLNTYEQFKNNDSVLRVLVATQSNSYLLKESSIDDTRLTDYYTNYQLKKKHIDWKLKIIPLKIFMPVEKGLFYSFSILFVMFYVYGDFIYGSGIPTPFKLLEYIAIFIGSMFLGALFAYGLIGGIFTKISNQYNQYLVKKVLE